MVKDIGKHKCVITFSRVAWTIGAIGAMWMALYLILSKPIEVNASDISRVEQRQYDMFVAISETRVIATRTEYQVSILTDAITRLEAKMDERIKK